MRLKPGMVISTTAVANSRPKPRISAIGDRNTVRPVAKKISGEMPRKVVMLVSRIGRTRAAVAGQAHARHVR